MRVTHGSHKLSARKLRMEVVLDENYVERKLWECFVA